MFKKYNLVLIIVILFLLMLVSCQAKKNQEPNTPENENNQEDESGRVLLQINNGQISGLRSEGVSVYKGIPYAKAPVGNLRFAPPEDVESWSGIKDCQQFGDTAVQTMKQDDLPMSEGYMQEIMFPS